MQLRFIIIALTATFATACVPGCSSTPPAIGGLCPREGCSPGLVCDPHDTCSLPCGASAPCSKGSVCSAASATCVECVADADCQVAGRPYCEASSGVCVGSE